MIRVLHGVWFGVCCAIGSGIALLIVVPSTVRADAETSSTPPARAVEAARIEAAGSISAHSIPKDERLRLWVTVSNPTPASIRDVWLLLPLEASDYEIAGMYKWSDQPGPRGSPSPTPLGSASAELISNELRPGESITVWADFLPRQAHAARALNALVSWKSAGEIPSQISVPLGDLQVPGRWDQWRDSFAYQMIKDFALPLTVLLLPWLIQRKAQQRAHVSETWNLMLPDSHRTTTTYYMPLQASLRNAMSALEDHSKETVAARKKEAARELFFYLLMFQRRLKYALDKLGGLYFKDRTGERLAVYSLIQFRRNYLGKDESGKVDTAQVLKHLGINETLDSFLEKLDGVSTKAKVQRISPLFQKRWEHFYGVSSSGLATAPATVTPWLGSKDFEDAILCLQAFRAIIEYEMNRPYEHWYGEKEIIHIDGKSERKLEALATEAASRENIPDFLKQVRKYLNKGKQAAGLRRKFAV